MNKDYPNHTQIKLNLSQFIANQKYTQIKSY